MNAVHGVVYRALESPTVEVSKRKMQVRAVWSDDTTDHYRTAFLPAGADLDTWSANSVVLWEHGLSQRGTLPVATGIEVGVDRFKGRNCLIGTAKFWEDDEFAEARFRDYAATPPRLRGWSIRAKPTDSSPPSAAERRARPDWDKAELVIRSWELLEVSAVSLPGNKNTLTISVDRSLSPASPAPSSSWPTPAQLAWVAAAPPGERDERARHLIVHELAYRQGLAGRRPR